MKPETTPTLIQIELKPTIGQIVGYVLPGGRHPGEVRPAIITRVWGPTTVNLQVFIDGENDYEKAQAPIWVTSSVYNENKEQYNTWHYLNLVESVEVDT